MCKSEKAHRNRRPRHLKYLHGGSNHSQLSTDLGDRHATEQESVLQRYPQGGDVNKQPTQRDSSMVRWTLDVLNQTGLARRSAMNCDKR